MRWVRTIVGILIIAAAAAAMYFWNAKGREDLATEKAKAEEEILSVINETVDPKGLMFEAGLSYFSIPKESIYMRSSLLTPGDAVALYLRQSEDTADNEIQSTYSMEKIGDYEIAYIGSDSVEIICSLADYMQIDAFISVEKNMLVLVAESSELISDGGQK